METITNLTASTTNIVITTNTGAKYNYASMLVSLYWLSPYFRISSSGLNFVFQATDPAVIAAIEALFVPAPPPIIS